MKILKFSEKSIIRRTKTEPYVTVRLFYPFCEGNTKAAKRVNALLHSVISSYADKALNIKAPVFLRHELMYKIVYNTENTACIYFELEKSGAEGLYNYRPFSITFDNYGRILPAPYPHSVPFFFKVKKAFASLGVRLSKKQFLYSFYPSESGWVIYAPKPQRAGRERRGVVKFSLENLN